MTNKEALKDFKMFSEECRKGNIVTLSAYCKPIFDTAIEALEKQIPKKPKQGELYFECANCGEKEIDFRHFVMARPKLTYCPRCGQAIDWSNDND